MKQNTVLFALSLCPNRIGGIEAFCRELAVQLQAKGWMLVLCFEGNPSVAVRDYLKVPGNVTLDVISHQAGMGHRGMLAFRRLLRRYRPSVVVYTLGGVVRWWPLLARMAGVKRVYYYDQSSRTKAAMRYKASGFHRWLMKPLTGAVCATRFVKSCCDREAILPPVKNIVIPNSVDVAPVYGDGASFRRRFEIPADRFVVLKISWLVPDKGIEVALQAARQALNRRNDLHFVFCGDGAWRAQYQKIAVELGLQAHVTWTGQVENLPESGAFRAANIQIQCSQWQEAFCLAVAEGMCAGLPVVASRIGGLPELVQDGLNGFLFDPSSSDQLARAILSLAADGELMTRMGEQGRILARQKYNVVENVGLWMTLLTP